jgi:RNA polymerase sigma-70 factor (ECF subfamily)
MTDVDLQALRRCDESAFRKLVHTHHATLFRLAMVYSPSRAIAEETVQETWLAVFRGLDTFAERSSLRTWMCRILVNIARRRAGVESRSLPFSVFEDTTVGVAVYPDRFVQSGPRVGRWQWTSQPADWTNLPEDEALSRELQDIVAEAVAKLPPRQREVITLRDVDGWTAAEVSDLLELEDGYQRVLLHRARSRVRQAVEDYLGRRGRAA